MMLIYSKKRADTFLFIYMSLTALLGGRVPHLRVIPEAPGTQSVRLFRIICGTASPFGGHRKRVSGVLSNGYTYPHNTAYYHYNKPPSQSQDFNTVFVIIDKSGAFNLCKSPKMPARIFCPAEQKIAGGHAQFMIVFLSPRKAPEFLRNIRLNDLVDDIHAEVLCLFRIGVRIGQRM